MAIIGGIRHLQTYPYFKKTAEAAFRAQEIEERRALNEVPLFPRFLFYSVATVVNELSSILENLIYSFFCASLCQIPSQSRLFRLM